MLDERKKEAISLFYGIRNEYNKLLDFFTNAKCDFQTNHYFDTKRFSLKALNASLRVRERETFELTFKRKKGYSVDLKSVPITLEEFNVLKESGLVNQEELSSDITNLIKEQKLVNFLSLSIDEQINRFIF